MANERYEFLDGEGVETLAETILEGTNTRISERILTSDDVNPEGGGEGLDDHVLSAKVQMNLLTGILGDLTTAIEGIKPDTSEKLETKVVQTLPVVGEPGIVYCVPLANEVFGQSYKKYVWFANKYEAIFDPELTKKYIDSSLSWTDFYVIHSYVDYCFSLLPPRHIWISENAPANTQYYIHLISPNIEGDATSLVIPMTRNNKGFLLTPNSDSDEIFDALRDYGFRVKYAYLSISTSDTIQEYYPNEYTVPAYYYTLKDAPFYTLLFDDTITSRFEEETNSEVEWIEVDPIPEIWPGTRHYYARVGIDPNESGEEEETILWYNATDGEGNKYIEVDPAEILEEYPNEPIYEVKLHVTVPEP